MAQHYDTVMPGDTLEFDELFVNASSVPTTLAGSPVVKMYTNASTSSETTTGVTLQTVDHDSMTGAIHVTVVVATAGCTPGNYYILRVTTGTVNSVSVVGYVVGTFRMPELASLGLVDYGTAGTVTATTIVLPENGAPITDTNAIVGAIVHVRSATAGAGQSRYITAYNISTNTATVDTWTTTPTGTVKVAVFAGAPGSTLSPPSVNIVQKNGTTVANVGTDGRELVSADTHTAGATVAAVAGAVGSVTNPVAVNTIGGHSLTDGGTASPRVGTV